MSKQQNPIDGIKPKTKKAKSIDGIKTKKKTPKNSLPKESLISDITKPVVAKEEIFDNPLSEDESKKNNTISEEELVAAFTEKPTKKNEVEPKGAKKIIIRILKYLLLAIELGSATILLFNIFKANVLNILYLSIIIAVIVLLFAFTAFKLIRKKTKTPVRITCIILSILLSTVYIVGTVYLSKTISFLEKITTQREYATENYSVIVLKKSELKTIESLSSKKIGFSETNQHLDLVESKLSETISFEPVKQENLSVMMLNLKNNVIDALTLSDSQLDLLKEEQKEFYDSIEIIFTFSIEFKIENATNNIDISSQPFILYISGSDDTGSLTETGRSDVNMVTVVNPETGKILLVSVPRDYYVQLHGTTGTKDKLTHAGMYGTEMSRTTLEDLFSINIDYTAKVGFNTVKKIVDAIDGININSDAAFTAWGDRSCYITLGPQHLDGRCALAFARERHAYATGDRHRGQNQQAVLTAIFEKITRPEYLINYPNILAALENDLITTFTYDQITSFAKEQLNTLKKWNIESISVDGTGSMQPTYSMGSQPLYVMYPDENTVNNARNAILKTLGQEPEESPEQAPEQ